MRQTKVIKNKVLDKLRNSQNVAVMAHRKGDSDSFGSMVALKLALEQIGKEVTLISEAGFPSYLKFLEEYAGSFAVNLPQNTDALIVVDCSEVGVTSFPEMVNNVLNSNIQTIQIDHHSAGNLAKDVDISWVNDKCCATAEMIYELILKLGVQIDKKIATALLAGIEGDTSSFQNQNTTENCMLVAGDLVSKGARLNKIIKGTESDKDINTLKLWGLALERLKVNSDGVAVSFLSYKDAIDFGMDKSSFGPVTNFLNSVKGVKMLVLLTEETEGEIKVSLRTRDENVDVSTLAKAFGGGGHVKAAGFSFPGHFELTDNQLKIV